MSDIVPYSFPLLKGVEIITCINNLGIPFTAAHLKTPTEDSVRPVLERLTEVLKGVGRDDLKQMQFAAMDSFQFPDIHEESIENMGMIKEMLALIHTCGVTDVSLNDLCNPTPLRVKRILSALINFAKFREDKWETFSNYTTQSSTLTSHLEALQSSVDELESKRLAMEKENAHVEPQIATVQAEADALKQQVNALSAAQIALRSEVKDEKALSHALAENLTAVNGRIGSTSDENAKLRAQIVHEPEKLKQSLKDMSAAVHAGRATTAEQSLKLKASQARLTNLTRVQDKIASRNDMMASALGEASNVSKLRRSVAEQSETISALESTVSDLSSQESALKANLSESQEKLFALQKNFESKRITASAALEQVQNEREALERMLDSQRAQAEQAENCLALKKQQLANQSAEHARTMAQMRAQYAKLQQAVGEYHTKLADVIHQATIA